MKLLLFLFPVLFSYTLSAQNQTVATGGSTTGSGGSISYTIGLPLYTNQRTTSVVVTQGVQQPFEILTGHFQKPDFDFAVKLYPNPAVSFFYLDCGYPPTREFNFKLFAMDGKLLLQSNVIEQQTLVDIKSLASGMYLFQLYTEGEMVYSAKILKIN